MIHFVPIEPYEERYTEQWYRWFGDAFSALGVEHTFVDGEMLTSTIEIGQVLDVYGTHYYKASQMQKLMGMLREGLILDEDTIFFADLWFPGIEALQYVRDMTGAKFKIEGVLHAGTWDKHDFTYLNGMERWAMFIENGWLKFIDKVYLGSAYHKTLIMRERLLGTGSGDRLKVTGLPFEWREVNQEVKKEKIVVFPHRLDPEKGPDRFDELAEAFGGHGGWRFIKTKDICQTKEEYYQLLGKASIAVSFAEQETFGYAMLEAIANRCMPLVPDKLSYKTMDIYDGYRFNDIAEVMHRIDNFKDYERPVEKLRKLSTINFIKSVLPGGQK